MSKHWLAGAVLALAALSSHADPQSTYQWMIHNQAISSAVAQSSQAVVTIGPLFYTYDYPSQQNLSATAAVACVSPFSSYYSLEKKGPTGDELKDAAKSAQAAKHTQLPKPELKSFKKDFLSCLSDSCNFGN